jgi:hypothetical protein
LGGPTFWDVTPSTSPDAVDQGSNSSTHLPDPPDREQSDAPAATTSDPTAASASPIDDASAVTEPPDMALTHQEAAPQSMSTYAAVEEDSDKARLTVRSAAPPTVEAQPQSVVTANQPADIPAQETTTSNEATTDAMASEKPAMPAPLARDGELKSARAPHAACAYHLHENDNAMETAGPFALSFYELLLEICHHPHPQCVADDQSEPLVIKIGSALLINTILAERAETDPQLRKLLDDFTADPDGEHVALNRECKSIDSALKRARSELAAKFFVAMTPAIAFTHEVIEYRVFLPLAVLRRQHANGGTQWHKGGGGGRLLIDATGNDMPNRLEWWKDSADIAQKGKSDVTKLPSIGPDADLDSNADPDCCGCS